MAINRDRQREVLGSTQGLFNPYSELGSSTNLASLNSPKIVTEDRFDWGQIWVWGYPKFYRLKATLKEVI